MPTFVGVDPGASGGIAAIDRDWVWAGTLRDQTERDICEMLIARQHEAENGRNTAPLRAAIELVGPNRNRARGEVRQGASSMFAFGRSYGFLRGLLVGLAVPFEEVRPVEWQRPLGLLSRHDEKSTDKKRRHKALAQQLFPDVRVTLDICDALLIAEWLRRRELGEPGEG